MIVLDASVLVAQLEADDRHHDRAAGALLAAADEELAATTIILAEVLVGPARHGRLEVGQALLRDLGVVELPLASDAGSRLAALRALTGLRLPDCCVLLAAQEAGAHAIVTFDDRLAREARRLGLVA